MDYYFISDLNKVAKIENYVPYIYDKNNGWVVDNKNILMDRIMGYDGESIGNSSELFKVDSITEEQANKIIKNL
ncbi:MULTISPECIES: hypothetical protein [unclassified Clostridium]|uniref:hypothetical protein n=1 Tax=unclassified Clostridium TaxID=2614128 RepID=UPI00290CCE5A|nr:hypothetical protein [Clostridium sp.]MDU5106523.1 hypothetical protein [Clostridium sp.]